MLGKKTCKKIIGAALTAFLSVPVTALTVQAEDNTAKTSDVYGNLANETGSITLEMKNADGPVGGGEVAAYRVADIQSGDKGYYFSYLSAFGKGELTDPSAENLAKELSEKAGSVKADATESISDKGVAKFSNLPTGVYLVVETKAADGYYTANPFLVTLPQSVDSKDASKITLDVVASPKVGPVAVVPTPKPAEPQKELAKTGLLYWPIGVLLAGGIVLCVAGVMKHRKVARG